MTKKIWEKTVIEYINQKPDYIYENFKKNKGVKVSGSKSKAKISYFPLLGQGHVSKNAKSRTEAFRLAKAYMKKHK